MRETESMNFDEPLPELASAIAGLELSPLQTPIEQMCYAAGFEAGRKRAGAWQKIAAMLVLTAGAIVVWDHRPPHRLQSPDFVNRSSATTGDSQPLIERSFSPVMTASNLRLRQAMLSQGWDALPPSTGDRTPPPGPLNHCLPIHVNLECRVRRADQSWHGHVNARTDAQRHVHEYKPMPPKINLSFK